MYRDIKNFFKVFVIATKRFFYEDYTYRASALTYTVLLALVPLVATIVYISSYFPFFSKLIDNARTYIWENIVPGSIANTEKYFQNFVNQASQLPLIGIVFLFITAVLMVNTIEGSLNEAWKITVPRKRIAAFFFYSFSIFITPILIGLIVLITTYVLTFTFFGYGHYINFFIGSTLPLVINTCLFTAIYKFIPNTYVHWKHALFGGIASGILFEFTRLFFGLYVQRFSSYEVIYGTFATIPIFLIWLYFFWFIILWGALLTHTVSEFKAIPAK